MSKKSLGFKELVAIAIGGMVGGGIFTILGIAISMVGELAPYAIALGGVIAFFASYSYVKLGVFYKDEGATYAFFKRTYPNSHLAASFIGWYTIFGYISTIALYAYTFASYSVGSLFDIHNVWVQKSVAISVIFVFALINIWSTKGMGKIEDILVYTKLLILFVISGVFLYFGDGDISTHFSMIQDDFAKTPLYAILIVSSVTFVAYEGFQLVINAVNEMDKPDINIPKAIYTAIILVATIYFIISLGALWAIPKADLIANKEYALAAGAKDILGVYAERFVVFGAILATSSAISGTLFGASRQLARISDDGYMPKTLRYRHNLIPTYAIIAMALMASLLLLSGGLIVILEFGSITFLLVSLLMAVANFKIRVQTKSSTFISLFAIATLSMGSMFILYYEYTTQPMELVYILSIYTILSIFAYTYAKLKGK